MSRDRKYIRLAAALIPTVLLLPPTALAQTHASSQPPRPHILGVAHIALYAKNYEESLTFYRDFLGFEEPYSLRNADGSAAMTFFKVNERQYIIIAPERQAGSDRLIHIGLETDDAEGLRAYLASRGVAVPDKVKKGRIGNLNFTFKDPEGRSIEVVQDQPESWTVREKGRYVPLTRISTHMMHVGIVVTSLDRELQFYRDVLGFTEFYRGSKSGDVLSWVNLRVPDGEDYVEFMLYKDTPSDAELGTAHHLALETPSVASSVKALEAKPYYKQYARPIEVRVGVNRKRQANLFDPDGTRTELMEPSTVDGKPAVSSSAPPPR
jgi:lactoylglutathione lyase